MVKDMIAALLVVTGVAVAGLQGNAEGAPTRPLEGPGWQVPTDLPKVLGYDAALDRQPIDCARVRGARLGGPDHAARRRNAPARTPRRTVPQHPVVAQELAP